MSIGPTRGLSGFPRTFYTFFFNDLFLELDLSSFAIFVPPFGEAFPFSEHHLMVV